MDAIEQIEAQAIVDASEHYRQTPRKRSGGSARFICAVDSRASADDSWDSGIVPPNTPGYIGVEVLGVGRPDGASNAFLDNIDRGKRGEFRKRSQ